MFPKNKIDIFYRVICLLSYIIAIFIVNSLTSIIILGVIYAVFALCEKSFRNIELIILSIIIYAICYLLNNYLLFKIMLAINYCIYYLDTGYYEVDEKVVVSKKDYIRFSYCKKKKGSTDNLLAVYLTVHLGLLVIAILVG